MATTTQLPAGLRTARLVAGAMIFGVTTFALVAWFVVRDRTDFAFPVDASLLLYAWVVVAFSATMAAIILWRGNVAPKLDRVRTDPDNVTHASALLTALTMIWGLMEGPALFALVIYFVSGLPLALAAGILMAWLGIGLTFPRAPWFPAPHRRTHQQRL